jgi:hypothetical protein
LGFSFFILPRSCQESCQNLMRLADAQRHFQTPHSPRIHEKNRNLTPDRNVVAASPIAGKAWIGRSINTIQKTVQATAKRRRMP